MSSYNHHHAVRGRHHDRHRSNSKKRPCVTTLKQVVQHSTDDISTCINHSATCDTISLGAALVELDLQRNLESGMKLSMS